jgi:hypothetical protein
MATSFVNAAMDTKRILLLLILLTTVFFLSCSSSDEQREFERQAMQPPSGYTQTDASGTITGSIDRDDWRIAPFFEGRVSSIEPAYPNPVQSTERVYIELNIFLQSVNGIQVFEIENGSFLPDALYEDLNVELGMQSIITFPANQLGRFETVESITGLKRILIFDGNNNLISYGDIMVE